MRIKPGDKLYSGVSQSKIQSAHPEIHTENFKLFVYYIKERYKIHKRKDLKHKPYPWTEDEILRIYRFTNVRREHDKETRWLIENIAHNTELTYENKILNCVLFRLYNNHKTSEFIGQPINFNLKSWYKGYKQLYNKFQQEKLHNPDRKFFTSAFYTSGLKKHAKLYTPEEYEDCVEIRIIFLMQYLIESGFIPRLKRAKSQRHAYRIIKNNEGIGDFLAYQIFVDLTYIPEFPYSENEFTSSGIGCERGLEYVFKNKDHLSSEACIFWIRDNWDRLVSEYKIPWDAHRLFSDLPDYDQCMNVMSLENCFCEFSKYMRALTGTGRPRVKYIKEECDLYE